MGRSGASTDAIAWPARCQPAGGETGVLECIAEGMQSEAAASARGVSQPLGPRWFREVGGIPPISLVPNSGRYLSFAEREEIALLKAQRCGVREVARQLVRSPSTISRPLPPYCCDPRWLAAVSRAQSACLRTGRALRVPRARTRQRGKQFITLEVMISQRPAEVADRAVRHWEGELIMGPNSSANR